MDKEALGYLKLEREKIRTLCRLVARRGGNETGNKIAIKK